MKKKLFSTLLVIVLAITLVACADTNQTTNGNAETENETAVSDPTETPAESTDATTGSENSEAVSDEDGEAVHTHEYAEEIVVAATCTESGTVSYTCECGDTYSEEIEPTGHDWGDYVANGDETYLADGTKTATCTGCGETDTIADDGSKLAYTYTDCEAVKYAQQTVNVRDLPTTDGNKVGSLSTNDEVTVTGTCNETGWYRIVYGDGVAYVSNKYLGDSKVEVSAPPADNGGGGNSNAPAGVPNPYELPLQTWIDMGNWFLYIQPSLDCPEYDTSSSFWHDKDAILKERNPGCMTLRGLGIKLDNGTWSAWMVTEGYGDQYPFPASQQAFLRTYQY